MIAQLRGQLTSKTPTVSVIECGGVGYEVFHTPFTAEHLVSGEVKLFIHTYVKEDILQLFGFYHEIERESFRNLIRVSSVGPKLALGILSGISHRDLWNAIQAQDVSRLKSIPGVGKKTAERLSLELKDRLPSVIEVTPSVTPQHELESVLINLGYQRQEVQKTISALSRQNEDFHSDSLELAVKQALAVLTRP